MSPEIKGYSARSIEIAHQVLVKGLRPSEVARIYQVTRVWAGQCAKRVRSRLLIAISDSAENRLKHDSSKTLLRLQLDQLVKHHQEKAEQLDAMPLPREIHLCGKHDWIDDVFTNEQDELADQGVYWA